MPPGSEKSTISSYMNVEEIERIAHVMVSRLGVDKIRLTGGEPTIRKEFPDILNAVSKLGIPKLGITTNGVLLHRYWDNLIAANVKYINISLDTLDREKFPLISNVSQKHWDRTWEAIEHAVDLQKRGYIESVKVNTVVMRHHNDDELEALVDRLTRSWPVQLRFIELMPFSGNNFSKKLLMSKIEIHQRLRISRGLERVESGDRDRSASVGSDLFQVPGYVGTVGVISSMTDNFCGKCDRLRLTSDGKIRNCLFSSVNSELDLLGIVRDGGSDSEIEAVVRKSIGMKAARHGGRSGVEDILKNALDSRPMVSIGG